MHLTESQRRWVYGIVIAALPILAAYGLLSGDQVSLWLVFAAAVLGVSSSGLAASNVGTEPERYIGQHRADD